MPIATLKFNLPEEQHDFDNAINAGHVKTALWNFENQLRSWSKYHHDFTNADDALEKIREEFYRCMNEYNVDLE